MTSLGAGGRPWVAFAADCRISSKLRWEKECGTDDEDGGEGVLEDEKKRG